MICIMFGEIYDNHTENLLSFCLFNHQKMKNNSVFLLSLVVFLGCNSPSEEMNYTALSGATIYDGNGGRMENTTIIINDGVIESLLDSDAEIPENAEVIDLGGKFVTPGLIDAHVHFFQTAFFDSRPDALDLRDSLPYDRTFAYQEEHPERYYEAYLRSGITGVYDVGGFDWSIALQASAESNPLAPHVAAAGQLITPAPEERIDIFNLPDNNVMVHLGNEELGRNTVIHNSTLGSTGIKIWGISQSDSIFMKNLEAVVDEIANQNNKLIVHATNLEGARAALRLGAKVLVHSVQDDIVDDDFIKLAKQNETVLTPTLIVSRGYHNTYKAVLGEEFLLTDPNDVVDAQTKELLARANEFSGLVDVESLQSRLGAMERSLAIRDSIMATNLVKLFEGGVFIAVGTDAGNPGTVHGISIYDEMERMQEFGIPASEIIIMATRNGARAMSRLQDIGTIEIGKRADLAIFQNDPGQNISNMRSVTHFMKDGLMRSVKEKF